MKVKTKTLVLVLLAVVVLGAGFYFLFAGGGKGARDYADDNSPVMFFYSDECQFCQKQMPILEDLSKEGYRVKLMDVAAHPEYWAQYNVTGTPTFIAANNDRQVGLTQASELRAWLEPHNARIAQASA